MVTFDSDIDSNGMISLQLVDMLIGTVNKNRPDRSQSERVFTPIILTGNRANSPTTLLCD